MAETLQNEIIKFMFRRKSNGELDAMACLQLWFGKSDDTDIEIEARFGALVAHALDGGYSDWDDSPRGCLAHMILVDQFTRNIYRHTIKSFVPGDNIARRIAYTPYNWLEVLRPEECIFVPCLVMTHQENLEDQKFGLDFYERLEPRLPSELHILREIFEEHHRIIYLCGAFPHRDHYYGRLTTSIGRSLMENPKLRFDLPLVCNNGVVSFGHDPQKLWQSTHRSFDFMDRIDALVKRTAQRRSTIAGSWLTPKEAKECHQLFRSFDRDGSGFLDVGELAAVLASTGHVYTIEQVQEVVDNITGVKASSGITFEQFANVLRINLPPSDYLTIAQSRFDLFDLDHSGEVSFLEFAKCIQGLDELVTMSEIELMFKQADRDASGSISFDEFLCIMERRVSTVDPAFLSGSSTATRTTGADNNPAAGTQAHGDAAICKSVPTFIMPDWHDEKPVTVQVAEIELLDPGVT